MLCRDCLMEILKGMDEDDKRLLIALDENGDMNKEVSSLVTKLTTSKLRNAISRMKGAKLIKETQMGNSIMLCLSESGVEMINVIKES